MFNVISKEIQWGSIALKLENGVIARQADGSVTVTVGGTVVLCTVVIGNSVEADFLALSVNYQERSYAAGKIPGGFIKRETKPSDKEVLVSRLIDRSLRPLFPKSYKNEIQVICTVLSYDGENNPDILSIIGASAALMLTGIPFDGPVAAARVSRKGIELLLNSNDKGDLDLVVAGTKSSILMVESEAQELSADTMLESVFYAHSNIQPVITLIEEFVKEYHKVNDENNLANSQLFVKSIAETEELDRSEITSKIEQLKSNISEALKEGRKKVRSSLLKSIENNLIKDLEEKHDKTIIKDSFNEVVAAILRNNILTQGIRIGNRTLTCIREINCSVDYLPKTHGSALFTRGETQALTAVTIGTAQDEQMSEDISGISFERFMLHYNFPPYSVGETGILKAPGRREIGHGKLAQKAIKAVLPSKEDFPYAIRVVSEITESNGSSSMATVCSTSLSLMASGMPIKRHVAGIAMGLIKDGDNFAILSDIVGDEDHLGDMDFKVAGTSIGITALQMDIKIAGISKEIMEKAIKQAQEGIAHILSIMNNTIPYPRSEMSSNAPRILNMQIRRDKIKDVIGAGGKVIKEICEKSKSRIEVEETGNVIIASQTKEGTELASEMIKQIITGPTLFGIYDGIVTKVVDFGVFVKFLGIYEGLVHISEISNEHISNIHELFTKEDEKKVKVKIIRIERDGKIQLSIRKVAGEDNDEGDSKKTKKLRFF